MKSKTSKIGIIGGSGVEDLLFTKDFKSRAVETEYGQVNVKQGNIDNKTIVFLNRHGKNYASPSQINHRANIAALRDEGVEDIIATAAVGSINPRMRPGEFVALTDFIDFTKGRIETFTPTSFVDVSRPYSSLIVKKITNAAVKLRIKIHPGVTYVCTEGPRFETRAEIKMFGRLGADVVGMTNVPEAVLAAEAGIPYAVVGVVTNFAAGVSPKKVSAEEVVAVVRQRKEALSKLLSLVIKSL